MAKEVLSPAEERFERWRRGIGLFAGPVVFVLIYLIPIPFLSKEAHILPNLDKRFAFAIFSIRFIEESLSMILFACGAIAAFISMWISNTAATAMMFPITLCHCLRLGCCADTVHGQGRDNI